MAYDFKKLKQKIQDTEEWLAGELRNIQTGRATPSVLDGILVNSYGAKMKILELANIGVEDARTLRITPWNEDTIRDIEVAIRDSDIGVGVATDAEGLRVVFPELTGETRQKYLKIVGKKLEEARVSLRNERDDVWNEIQKLEQEGEMGEDEKFRLKEEMEKITKEGNEQLEGLVNKKEKDILG